MNEETRRFFEKLAGVDSTSSTSSEQVNSLQTENNELQADSSQNKSNAVQNLDAESESFIQETDSAPIDSPQIEIVEDQEEAKPQLVKAVKKEKEIDDDFDEVDGKLVMDVYQTPTDIIIEAPVAGVAADDVDLEISPESVTIKGRRSKATRVDKKDYLHQECYWGRFSRTVILPQEIDADNAGATFKNGVLTITLPKISRAKTKKVKVRFE